MCFNKKNFVTCESIFMLHKNIRSYMYTAVIHTFTTQNEIVNDPFWRLVRWRRRGSDKQFSSDSFCCWVVKRMYQILFFVSLLFRWCVCEMARVGSSHCVIWEYILCVYMFNILILYVTRHGSLHTHHDFCSLVVLQVWFWFFGISRYTYKNVYHSKNFHLHSFSFLPCFVCIRMCVCVWYKQ